MSLKRARKVHWCRSRVSEASEEAHRSGGGTGGDKGGGGREGVQRGVGGVTGGGLRADHQVQLWSLLYALQ